MSSPSPSPSPSPAAGWLRAELLAAAEVVVPGQQGVVVDEQTYDTAEGLPETEVPADAVTVEAGDPAYQGELGDQLDRVAAVLRGGGWQVTGPVIEARHHRLDARHFGSDGPVGPAGPARAGFAAQIAVHGWAGAWKLTLSGETPG